MALLNFDANTVTPQAPQEVIPAGWYTAMITESEMKETSNKQGQMLVTTMIVLDGEFKGRKIFDRMNLVNNNPTAVQIGYETLSAICHAVGVIQVVDSQQLHNRPLAVKVVVRAAQTAEQSNDGKPHEASNEVKGYKAAAQQQAQVPQFTPAPPPPQQAAYVAPQQMQPAPQQQAPAWAPPAQPQAPAYAPPAQMVQPVQQAAPQPAWAAAPAPAEAPVQQAPQQQAAPAPAYTAPATPPWLTPAP